MPKTNYVCKLTKEQTQHLNKILVNQGWVIDSVPYSFWRARKNKTTATAYESGKLSIQGKSTEELVQFIIEPEILKEARFGNEIYCAQQENPEMFQPHAGIDESGKGDYFGPLVIAAVFVNQDSAEKLLELGVQDSKAISSDKKIKLLASKVKTITNGAFSLVAIGPEAYNRMYNNVKNVNRILGWGHARVLENLLIKEPKCSRAVSDQFGNKSTVLNALLEKGKKIKLEQKHKAESDIAVAAASILAREEFLRRLQALSDQLETPLPKGASAEVLKTAALMIRRYGLEKLEHYVKFHFRTTEKAKLLSEK